MLDLPNWPDYDYMRPGECLTQQDGRVLKVVLHVAPAVAVRLHALRKVLDVATKVNDGRGVFGDMLRLLAYNRRTVDDVIGPILEAGHGEDAEGTGRSAWRAQTLPAAAAKHALEVSNPLLQLQELINDELSGRSEMGQ